MQSITLAPLLAIFAAVMSTQTYAQSDRCLDATCFNSDQVRDFEVIEGTTLIVYVGRQRCPFLIELDGLFCDATYIPDIGFIHEREARLEQRQARVEQRVTDVFRANAQRNRMRVCTHTANQFALDTFGFGGSESDVPTGRLPCEIRNITPLSDDEILELFVDEGLVPPPPPIGTGEISRATSESDDQLEHPPADIP